MNLEDFRKLLQYKMQVLENARDQSYQKVYKYVEEASSNDNNVREIGISIETAEKSLQDMFKVINNVVDRQLEEYDKVNTEVMGLKTKKKDDGKLRPKVKFVDVIEEEDEEEANDGTFTKDKSFFEGDSEALANVVIIDDSKENDTEVSLIAPIPKPAPYVRQMPVSPVLQSTISNPLLASVIKGTKINIRSNMPVTPPTAQKFVPYKEAPSLQPIKLNFDDTLV